jgi:hypothetical protein
MTGDQPTEEQDTENQWFFLVDPEWQPTVVAEGDADDGDADAEEGAEPSAQRQVEPPPPAALVGGWLVQPDGRQEAESTG